MNKLKIFVIPVILSAVLLSKPLIPSNGTSVILEGNKKEYIYYKFGKGGLVFNNNKSEFSLDDSVRIKLFIRTITNELNKEELLKVKVEIATENSDVYDAGLTKSLKYSKGKSSNFKIKNRPAWKVTKAGIWFMDISVSKFNKIKISGDKNLIVKATIDQIDRGKYSKVNRTLLPG